MTSHTCKHKEFYTYVNWKDIKPSFDSDIMKYVLDHIKFTINTENNFISIKWNYANGIHEKTTYLFDNFDLFKNVFDNYETHHLCYFCDKDEKRERALDYFKRPSPKKRLSNT